MEMETQESTKEQGKDIGQVSSGWGQLPEGVPSVFQHVREKSKITVDSVPIHVMGRPKGHRGLPTLLSCNGVGR